MLAQKPRPASAATPGFRFVRVCMWTPRNACAKLRPRIIALNPGACVVLNQGQCNCARLTCAAVPCQRQGPNYQQGIRRGQRSSIADWG